jgi:transposase
LDNKKQRWQERNSQKMNYMIKHRYARKLWTNLRKFLKKGVNTEYLDPDRCLSHLATLFTNNNDGIPLKGAQILEPGYNDKQDDVFTTLEVRNFILKIKNNKVSGCDSLPVEVWKRLIIKTKEHKFYHNYLIIISNLSHDRSTASSKTIPPLNAI